jgi:MerR family transcriptional regulator, light-induced transcriptional regulator
MFDTGEGSVGRSAVGTRFVAEVTAAAFALDSFGMERVLEQSLREIGVVDTWDHVIRPTFVAISEEQAASGKCIDIEHAFSWIVSRSLQRIPASPPTQGKSVPLVLACTEGETHSLPLEAMYAALAEHGRPSLMLGAAVPAAAVVDALAHQTQRAAAMLWSQSADTADRRTLDVVQSAACFVIVGGPGWQGVTVRRPTKRVLTLHAAVDAVLAGI